MTITLKIRPLDRKVRTSVYLVKSRRGKLRNGEKVCLGKPIEKDGRFNYAVYKVNDANSVVGNLGNITTDQRDLSGDENKFQKLNELDESVWNELDSARPSPAEPDSTGASPKSDPESPRNEPSEDEPEASDESPRSEDEPEASDEPESPRSEDEPESPAEVSKEERSPTQELFKSTAGSAKNARRGNKKTQKILPLKKIIPLHM